MEYLKDPKYYQVHQFIFDHIFDEKSDQEKVYKIASKDSINSILDGFNSTIIAYGQTGTGKTYTMEGDNGDKRGIIPRAIQDWFERVNLDLNCSSDVKYTFKASFFQIYNEQIYDLLNISNKNLNIRENNKDVFVENLSEYEITNYQDALNLIIKGNNNRNTASTKMNIKSSRSHAIFILYVEKYKKGEYKSYAKLNLVDLAGSERLRITNAKGQRLEECKRINQSLAELANVINALCNKNQRNHIPYRNNKLTRLLEDSLGGNCKTTILATISPHLDAFNETISTLKFATRSKKIYNHPISNKKIDTNPNNLLKKYENDIKKLKKEKKFEEIINNKENNLNKESFFEENIHINKYKSLLLKQREILISLTDRLNSRDELIKKLKKELDDVMNQNIIWKEKVKSKEDINKESDNNLFNNISIKNEKNNEFLESFDKDFLLSNKKEKQKNNIKDLIILIKDNVDDIILNLSKQNESLDLHKIAKSLLKVQKNINNLVEYI